MYAFSPILGHLSTICVKKCKIYDFFYNIYPPFYPRILSILSFSPYYSSFLPFKTKTLCTYYLTSSFACITTFVQPPCVSSIPRPSLLLYVSSLHVRSCDHRQRTAEVGHGSSCIRSANSWYIYLDHLPRFWRLFQHFLVSYKKTPVPAPNWGNKSNAIQSFVELTTMLIL